MGRNTCNHLFTRPRGSSHGKKQYACLYCGKIRTLNSTRPSTHNNSNSSPCNNSYPITYHSQYPSAPAKYFNSSHWQYTHRLVMMLALGRKLDRNEHIDHIDGNKHNSDITNLRVITPIQHGKRHKGKRYKANTRPASPGDICSECLEGVVYDEMCSYGGCNKASCEVWYPYCCVHGKLYHYSKIREEYWGSEEFHKTVGRYEA